MGVWLVADVQTEKVSSVCQQSIQGGFSVWQDRKTGHSSTDSALMPLFKPGHRIIFCPPAPVVSPSFCTSQSPATARRIQQPSVWRCNLV